MGTPHTTCTSGTRVEIKLKDDTVINGKFYENKGKFIELRDGRKIPVGKVRSMRIGRGPKK